MRSVLQAERFAADRVEVRQGAQLVVRDLFAVLLLGPTEFGAELVLCIPVHAQEV